MVFARFSYVSEARYFHAGGTLGFRLGFDLLPRGMVCCDL